METENFDTPPAVPEPPPAPARRRFPLPAEYYSTPPGDRRPLVAPWAATGCGVVSIVLLAMAFTGGYVASHGGALAMMNWFIERSRTDIASMYAKDVTAEQKSTFDREMKTLQKNMAAKRVGLDALQPVLRDMRDAVLDSTVSSKEADKLIADLRTANGQAKPK